MLQTLRMVIIENKQGKKLKITDEDLPEGMDKGSFLENKACFWPTKISKNKLTKIIKDCVKPPPSWQRTMTCSLMQN